MEAVRKSLGLDGSFITSSSCLICLAHLSVFYLPLKQPRNRQHHEIQVVILNAQLNTLQVISETKLPDSQLTAAKRKAS